MNYKLTETGNNYTIYNWHVGKLISKAPIKIYHGIRALGGIRGQISHTKSDL